MRPDLIPQHGALSNRSKCPHPAPPDWTCLDLPVATINVSQRGLEDVRLLSPTGVETPLVMETSAQEPPRSQAEQNSHTCRAATTKTVLLTDTGTSAAVHSLLLETPSRDFIYFHSPAGYAGIGTLRWSCGISNRFIAAGYVGINALRWSCGISNRFRALRATLVSERSVGAAEHTFHHASSGLKDHPDTSIAQRAMTAGRPHPKV